MGDIQEVLEAEVFRDAVLLPGPAAHRQREFETAVESTAVSKRVREINKHSNNRQILGQLSRPREILRVKTRGMAASLKI